MIKIFTFLLVLGFTAPALADDFGARFDNEAPAALSDSVDMDAAALQNIEPAAGDDEADMNEPRSAAAAPVMAHMEGGASIKGTEIVYE